MTVEFQILIVVLNIFMFIWFVVTMNQIKSAVKEIARYSRRVAISTPLTQGQMKLINKSFSAKDLVVLLEKNGAELEIMEVVEAHYEEDMGPTTISKLKIHNPEIIDPELISLLSDKEKEVIEI